MRFPADVPRLVRGEVTLRAHRLDDADAIVEQCTDPESIRWTTVPLDYDLAMAVDWVTNSVPKGWESGTERLFAIETGHPGGERRFSGSLSLRDMGDRRAEIAFGAHPAVRGRGVMTTAVDLLLDYGFDEVGLETVIWLANVGNIASRRVAWKSGFTFGGVLRRWLDHRGEALDAWAGTLHRSDERSPQSRWVDVPVKEEGGLRRQPLGTAAKQVSNGDDVPRLSDGRVTLRQASTADVAGICELVNDPVSVEQSGRPAPCTPEIARHLLERGADGWRSGEEWRFSIEAEGGAGAHRFAGTIALHNKGSGIAEIGFATHPAVRGQGVMTSALRQILDWGFAVRGLGSVRWQAQVGNYASWRVAWRNGFTFESSARGLIPHRGNARDAWVASLLSADTRDPKTTWRAPLRIEHVGVVLRDISAADESRYLETMNDPVSLQWLGTISMPRTPEAFRAMMRSHLLAATLGQSVSWTVADPTTDDYLASASLFGFDSLDYKSAELGYRTHPDARGRGVLASALRAVIAHAFRPEADGGLGLDRIHLGAGDGNAASHGVARSCGFTATGRDRSCYDLYDGSVVDLIRYDLLRSEWTARD